MDDMATQIVSNAVQCAVNPAALLLPNPDLSLFRHADVEPPEFDSASLPPVWMEWAEQTARAKACPADFVALNLVVMASAWLGNSCRVRAAADWIEPPHLWGAIISPPSGGKTPSQDPFIAVCKLLEADAEPEWEFQRADYEKRAAYAKAKQDIWRKDVVEAAAQGWAAPDTPLDAREPEPIGKPRLIVCEGTTQEIINILAHNPKGLAVMRDELSGWFGSFDRYTGSGADRGFYLESWNGGRYSVDLVKHSGKPVVVPYTSLAILGGIQPDKLREALSGADDGLTARFCYTWPRLVPYAQLSRESVAASQQRQDFLLSAARRLRGLQMVTGISGDLATRVKPLSTHAMNLFETIRCEAIGKARTTKGLAAGWHGKTPARALRLALVMEFLFWAAEPGMPEPQEVSAKAMAHAGTFLDYLSLMFDRVINGLAADQAETDAATIMKHIAGQKPDTLNERELYQSAGFGHFRNGERRRVAFKILERDGWLIQAQTFGAGRKRNDWQVNPRLWEALA